MTKTNTHPKLKIRTITDTDGTYLQLERGQLSTMKIKLPEARALADTIHDLMDELERATP